MQMLWVIFVGDWQKKPRTIRQVKKSFKSTLKFLVSNGVKSDKWSEKWRSFKKM